MLRSEILRKLEAYRAELGETYRHSLADGAEIVLTVCRDDSSAGCAELGVQESTEVFWASFAGRYEHVVTDYEPEDKLETVDDLLGMVGCYVEGRFHEKVYESFTGKEMYRELFLEGDGGTMVIGSNPNPMGLLRKALSTRHRVVRPEK